MDSDDEPRLSLSIDFDLTHFLGRLDLEYRMLKASSRHTIFCLTYAVIVLWLAISHDPRPTWGTQAHLRSFIVELMLDKDLPVDAYVTKIQNLTSSLGNSKEWQSWTSVLSGSKRSLQSCDRGFFADAMRAQKALVERNSSCLSESDDAFVNATCSGNFTCDGICTSFLTEPLSPACLISPSNSTIFQGELAVVANRSVELRTSPLLASLSVDILTKSASGSLITLIQTSWNEEMISCQISCLGKQKADSVIGIAVCFGACAILILLDIKNVLKKARSSSIFHWWKYLSLLHTLCLPAIVGLRWLFNERVYNPSLNSILNRSMPGNALQVVWDFKTLLLYKNMCSCFIFLLVMTASYRLFRILSVHPKTAVLYYVVVSKRWELLYFVLSLSFVLFYFCTIWFFVTGKWIAQYLIQVPFGVWPYTDDNRAVLIVFGLITFHFLAVVFQVIVNSGYKEFRSKQQSSVALNFHEDVWVAMKRFIARRRSKHRWPHRLVLLLALENIKNGSGKKSISINDLRAELDRIKTANFSQNSESKWFLKLDKLHRKELGRFDPEALVDIWDFYAYYFGHIFLFPKNAKTARDTDSVVQEIRERMSENSRAVPLPSPNLPPVEEIRKRTLQLKRIKLSNF